jgi:hypothetical protein
MSLTMHLFSPDLNRGLGSDSQDVSSLVESLGSEDGITRRKAREMLVALDGATVPALISALSGRNRNTRWEAAKALGEIGDPAAAPALVEALEDERFGVRWLAAEALISLGKDAVLAPLMRALVEAPDSVWLRHGAHHVLRTLARDGLPEPVQGVLAALEDLEPAVECPTLASHAYQYLTGERLPA